MLARVDVLGHSHTLACEIEPNARPESLRIASKSCTRMPRTTKARPRRCSSRPIFRRKRRPSAKSCSASYLDLEGNARLALGEVFIGKRSMPARAAHRGAGPAFRRRAAAAPACAAVAAGHRSRSATA